MITAVKKPGSTESTMLVITVGFLILYKVFSWEWAFRVSMIVGLTGILSPYLSRRIEWLWLQLSKLLSRIVPNVLLSLVFYFILFPLSLLSKISKKDPLLLSDRYDSCFRDVNVKPDPKSFEKIW